MHALKLHQEAKKSTFSDSKSVKQQGTIFTDIIYKLKKDQLLPAVFFIFSRKGCEEALEACAGLNLTSDARERSAIHMFLQEVLEGPGSPLSPQDILLPQITRMREAVERGLAVHHSGVLPVLKEAVEILFGRGLLKVLFATETFAMGVNMPARTVVFASTRKHDGKAFRPLHPGEYTQMAGRAGRRGKDTIGTVILITSSAPDFPAASSLQEMILGEPKRLTSRFRLTYSMILNLLRVEDVEQGLSMEEMIRRSFGENASQRTLPEESAAMGQIQEQFDRMPSLDCWACREVIKIGGVFEEGRRLRRSARSLHPQLLGDLKGGWREYLPPGQILLVTLPAKGSDKKEMTGLASVVKVMPGERKLCVKLLTEPALATNPINKLPSNENIKNGPREKDISAEDILFITKWKEKDLTAEADLLVGLSSVEPIQYAPVKSSLELDTALLTFKDHLKTHFAALKEAEIKCPDWIAHYSVFTEKARLGNMLADMKFRLSDHGLSLMPEYRARLDVLQTLGFLDANAMVTLKGRVACELNTTPELLTTELLFGNVFGPLSHSQMASLMSALVFQEKADRQQSHEEIALEEDSPLLKLSLQRMQAILANIAQVQRECGLSQFEEQYELYTTPEAALESINTALMPAVLTWAQGASFLSITQMTPVLEGSIVRCIVRLGETMRELRSAGKLIGDAQLVDKAERGMEAIRRDICFASSLYYR